MAAAVLQSSKLGVSISNPFNMVSHKRADANTALPSAAASSSRLQPSSQSPALEAQPKTFKRLRSSLEQSLRTATKSKAKLATPVDETGVLAPTEGKGKEREGEVTQAKEKSRSRMLSKVSFRRPVGKDSMATSPAPPAGGERKDSVLAHKDKARAAAHTGFLTPSLRQASMSSPALPIPSAYRSFALPSESTSNVAALVSPPREGAKRPDQSAASSREISGPTPLQPRRDIRPNGAASPIASSSSKTRPPPLILSNAADRGSPVPETPTRRTRDGARSSDLSPPSPAPRGLAATKRAAASASHLPLSRSPSPPATPRAMSPNRARSSSRTPTHRAGPSASSSHLPLASTSSTTSARRPSFDQQRRPSVDQRRPSIEQARRPSIDQPRRPSIDQRRPSIDQQRRPSLDLQRSPSRAASPTTPTTPVRPRAVSPIQRNYSPNYYQNRFFNTSTASLTTTSNPECRELIRSASTFLCREMLKPPSQLKQSSLDPKEWEEVEVRMRGLARLERVWGKSGIGMSSSSQLSSAGGLSSSGLSAGGEEREKRLFCEAMRDGYVLCQLINKLFPGTISRVDPREDGFVRTSNVTKFLAACSSVGVRSDELFQRDDLIESNAESLARVARSVIALQKLTETAAPDRSKYIQGGNGQASPQSPGPYSSVASSRGATSTPNLSLAQMQRSTSPVSPQPPTGRKRWSPPQPLPTVRSDSPNEDGSATSSDGKTVSNGIHGRATPPSDADLDAVPPMLTPPPRSPLRPRTSVERASVADSTRASIGDSARASMAESLVPSSPMRQSQASSSMTDSTMFSSLLEVQRSSSGQNKFGTIRTVTTEATSLDPSETPSFTFTDGSSMAASLKEEFGRKRGTDAPTRPSRERRPSETAMIDLTRVIEEVDESGSSSKGSRAKTTTSDRIPEQDKEKQSKASPIKLGKGKWPDDFLDAFQAPRSSSPLLDDESIVSPSYTPLSISPPRKLAVVGASRPDASLESLPQFPRRPSHRARHSVDTPGLLPKDSVLRRDSSPDTGLAQSPPRIMLRRNSTKTGPHRNGVYIPRSNSRSTDSESRVPFPRAVSGERHTPPSDRAGVAFPSDTSNPDTNVSHDKPRQPRGRFQSEIDGSSSRRKPRPNSYDELGAKPRRSRFESMVNLGVVTSNASASDLMNRDSYDGKGGRGTLVVKEEGKPPTQFQLGNCIGRGQFGAVYRALNLNTGQMVAVKRIRLEGLKEEEIAQLMKEVDLVKSLSHPSIVKYEGMARDDDTLNIVLEYAENGSLGQTLKAFGKLNERLVANYVVKILEGLHYLHQSDVVHCDLKAANILTTKTGNVKLSDFGVSLNLRAMEREMKDVAGTPNWMAPEVIELKGASTKSDIWSLACTVIELLTGRPPYAEIANSMSVMFHIVEDRMPPLPEGCSESLQDFLKICFNKDPTKRPSAESLCDHEWLKKNWLLHNKELRPQDSIPFLRRVSADFQKNEAIRHLANIDMPDSDRSTPEQRPRLDEIIAGSPPRRRLSNDPESTSPSTSPREHSFVRTTFGKPVICRVCLQNVKKSAVLCEQCSLIAHLKCSPHAPPTCDLRAQLLLYAQYAENGNPTGPYSNPMELLEAVRTNAPTSATSESDLSPRTSMDSPLSQSPSHSPHQHHPPPSFKVFTAFKRSKSFLKADQDRSSASSPVSSAPANDRRSVVRKRSVLKRKSDINDRPQSLSSNSTSPNSSSMRSAVTATESLSSKPETVRRSALSTTAETDGQDGDACDLRLSQMTSYSVVSTASTQRGERGSTSIPGDLPRGKHRDRDSKSGCIVQ
ncbi:hypothetical protein AcV7_007316 [Taiwanofungus camphoratus]|nr:hypothetical protein AcV7_007316 [Antrodia cinnamomea]